MKSHHVFAHKGCSVMSVKPVCRQFEFHSVLVPGACSIHTDSIAS
jgi:hypothetical protein